MENIIIKKLRLEFCFIFIWAAVLIGLFEWDVWTAGWAVGNELADYYINLTGIIMVIVLVPMALKMMSFRVVKSSYSVGSPQRSGLKYKRTRPVLFVRLLQLWLYVFVGLPVKSLRMKRGWN